MNKQLLAEFIGTFTLSLAVLLSVSGLFPTPILAALVVTLFVYTIGGISGCHLNPAVTIGLLSVKKIKAPLAGQYIIVQVLGAVAALLLTSAMGVGSVPVPAVPLFAYVLEAFGVALLTFGVGAVVFDSGKASLSGVIIGGSLFLGITIASLGGAAGILNPAVAVSLKTMDVGYYLAQIVGGIIGIQAYFFLQGKR